MDRKEALQIVTDYVDEAIEWSEDGNYVWSLEAIERVYDVKIYDEEFDLLLEVLEEEYGKYILDSQPCWDVVFDCTFDENYLRSLWSEDFKEWADLQEMYHSNIEVTPKEWAHMAECLEEIDNVIAGNRKE